MSITTENDEIPIEVELTGSARRARRPNEVRPRRPPISDEIPITVELPSQPTPAPSPSPTTQPEIGGTSPRPTSTPAPEPPPLPQYHLPHDLKRPLLWFRRGKYFRMLGYAIISNRTQLVKEIGPLVQLADVWAMLRSTFPKADIYPDDVETALDKLSMAGITRRKLSTGAVVAQLEPYEFGKDEWAVMALAHAERGSLTLEKLMILAQQGWTRERIESALRSLEQVGIASSSPNGQEWHFRAFER